eukprot:gene1383-1405_t
MTDNAPPTAHRQESHAGRLAGSLTQIELTCGTVFALVRWSANDFGTVSSRIDIVRAVAARESYQTLPFVRPGGAILLHIDGWPKVERVLQFIDAVEAIGVEPGDIAPDHWRHVHSRLTVGHEPRLYSRAQHDGADVTRSTWVMATYFSVMATVGAAFVKPFPRLIWNTSASTPIGLCAVRPPGALRNTELVAVTAPEPVASFLADGATCRAAERLSAWAAQYIDQIDGDAQARDRRGRDLPDWQGCQTVAAGDVFLMNPGFPDCLDGRYFGPLPASSIVGQAVPLWTDEGDGGRFDVPMAHIGYFTRTQDSYWGRLRTLTIDVELPLVPANAGDGENAPDFRIHAGECADGPEVGAAWKRAGEKAGAYVSLLIADPVFMQPIHPNLFQAEAN